MAIHIRRREFIVTLGGAALAWPLAARAQQPAVPVVGYLDAGSPTGSANFVAAFREGLSKAGHFEGSNIKISRLVARPSRCRSRRARSSPRSFFFLEAGP